MRIKFFAPKNNNATEQIVINEENHKDPVSNNKKELYEMARKSYLMNNEEGNGDIDDFIHTQLFALIDKQKHIRGFYDGTNDSDVQKLIQDITKLKKEQIDNLK